MAKLTTQLTIDAKSVIEVLDLIEKLCDLIPEENINEADCIKNKIAESIKICGIKIEQHKIKKFSNKTKFDNFCKKNDLIVQTTNIGANYFVDFVGTWEIKSGIMLRGANISHSDRETAYNNFIKNISNETIVNDFGEKRREIKVPNLID